MSDGEYGLQRPEEKSQTETRKSLLEHLRHVSGLVGLTKRQAPEPLKEEGLPEPVGSASPVGPAVEPPALAEGTTVDLVEVRTPRFRYFTDGTPGGYNPTAETFLLRDGYDITYRPRRPEDGDAAVIIEEAKPPATRQLVPEPTETFAQWRQRMYNGGSTGRQAPDAIKVGPGAGRYVPERPKTITERQGGFANWGGR